jgi:LCP family protein required for cell wall assembly
MVPSEAPEDTPEPAPAPDRGRRLWLSVGIALSALLTGWSALMLLAEVTPALFPGQRLPIATQLPSAISALEIESPGPESVFNQPIVVLVAAVDERPNTPEDLQAVNTDTIMLVRLDPIAKDVRVLSVPRDLLVSVSYPDGSRSQDRVNTSFAVGAAHGKGVDAGMDHLQSDLERNFNIDIDYWVQLDFTGAERLIDALGGVDVGIPTDLSVKDWWYSDDDVTHKLLSFPPGQQHLDGYHAVAFARLRAPDDDLHRIKRQQLVLEAAFNQAFSSGLMADPMGLWSAYSSAIRTNVPSSRMPGFALLSKQVRGSLQTYSLGDPALGSLGVRDRILPSGAAVLAPVPEALRYWLDQVFGNDRSAAASIVSATNP